MALPQGQFEGFQSEGLWPTHQGLALRRGQFLKALGVVVVTFSAASVAAATVAEQAITGITGSTVNDVAILQGTGAPTAGVALLGTGRISVAGTVQARYVNPTAGALTPPASQTIFVVLLQVQ
jgi:hypothetical protein